MSQFIRKAILLLVSLSPLLTGCYFNDVVQPNEVAAQVDGGQVTGVTGPGVYTNLGFFADLVKVSSNTLVVNTDDPQVATFDNQLVGISVTVQLRRRIDPESIKDMLKNWRNIAADDTAFDRLVQPMVLQAVKVGAHSFTLQQLLNDRNGLADSIQKDLATEAVKFDSDVISIQVANVALDPKYAQTLQDKALLVVQQATELQRQGVISQTAANAILQQQRNTAIAEAQLETERANTAVQVEIATRAGKVVAAQNQVYSDNPQAFALAELDRYAKIFGTGTVYFIPAGTSLNMIMGPISGTLPIVR